MLRVIQNRSPAGAKSYYSQADYLSEGQELVGRWGGKASEMLGLSGEVDKESFDRLCDNLDPRNGSRLTLRTSANRTVGYDFNFHAPKGVTLAYMLGEDDRILDGFRQSVDETMRDIEADTRTRIRKHYMQDERITGNMAWAEFIHTTSRRAEEETEPSPHLHAHCFAFNCTFDGNENGWKAIQFREQKRDASYYEAIFHSRLAMRMRELGYGIERNGRDWDIAGLSKSTGDKFSARTQEIEKLAEELGIEDDAAKDSLGAKSRTKKDKSLTLPQLKERWHDRLDDSERTDVERLRSEMSAAPTREQCEMKAAEAMAFARKHCFERDSVIAKRRLLTEAVRKGIGEARSEVVHRQLEAQLIITRSMHGRDWATTPEVLVEERTMLENANRGVGSATPLNSDWQIQRTWLNEDQQAAVKHIVGSKDKVMMIKGGAGTGKTSLMQEAAEAIDAGGKRLFTFAPSSQAARQVLAEEGFDATTVAELLVNEDLQQSTAGNVIWIDEAGLLGTRTLKRVMDIADQNDARLVLSGDYRQHGSVERGAGMRLLAEQSKIKPAIVGKIQRQTGAYRDAISALSRGDTDSGLDQLDALGWVHEIEDADDRYQQMAKRFADDTESGRSVLTIAPTHKEADILTQQIRMELKARAIVGDAEHTFQQLRPLHLTEAEKSDMGAEYLGDFAVFHRKTGAFKSGDRVPIAAAGKLDAKSAQAFEVYRPKQLSIATGDLIRITRNGKTKNSKHRLNNGAVYKVKSFTDSGDIVFDNGWEVDGNYAFLTLGYTNTSHASQGKTVDHVLIAESSMSHPAAGTEQLYVSASRGRHKAEIFTDDKDALADAVARQDQQMAATELVDAECTSRRTDCYKRTRRSKIVEPEKGYEVLYERV